MKESFTQKSFPCSQCGASLIFSVDENALKCEYCNSITRIYPPKLPIYEHNLDDALLRLEKMQKVDLRDDLKTKCPSCGAGFKMDPHLRSTKCPFCSSPIVTNLDIFMPLAPESLLPFSITQKEAKEIFKKWISNLWFAPNSLKKFEDNSSQFKGIYLPYWTYDSKTTSKFKGLRGDTYYERVSRVVYIDGRSVRRDEMVPRIRWRPVQGAVNIDFDDMLIGATKTIPRKLAEDLEPWDLENLKPYDDRYLSGFLSETYQVALDDGFRYAKEYMSYSIQQRVRREIGGDKQQITDLKIYHQQSTFKYILLPIWTANFKSKNREYRFAINARSGTIKGERPYSKVKIVSLILIVLLALGALLFFAQLDNSMIIGREFNQIYIEW